VAADPLGGLGRCAADPVPVEHEHGRLTAGEDDLHVRPGLLLAGKLTRLLQSALDGGRGDGARVGRLADLVGEELPEEPDADDEQDQQLDRGDRGRDERGVAPGRGGGEVCAMIHGPV
jgi:hypothetical protein